MEDRTLADYNLQPEANLSINSRICGGGACISLPSEDGADYQRFEVQTNELTIEELVAKVDRLTAAKEAAEARAKDAEQEVAALKAEADKAAVGGGSGSVATPLSSSAKPGPSSAIHEPAPPAFSSMPAELRDVKLVEELAAAPSTSAPSTSDNASTQDNEWTAAKWMASVLESCGGMKQLGQALIPPGATDELAALRALGKDLKLEGKLLSLLMQALPALAKTLVEPLKRLGEGEAITDGELQSKFSTDVRGFLEYASLNTFYGGLEAKIGSPDPKVEQAMEEEHTLRGDSNDEFTTNNYDITTTSSTEWKFVASPDQPLEGGWPVEKKLVRALEEQSSALPLSSESAAFVKAGAQQREPMPRDQLKHAVEEKNAKLRKMQEALLQAIEAMAARLYTGPLFVKYNAVLRGLETEVPFLRNDMIQRCCAKQMAECYVKGTVSFEDACKQLNKYTTTLHAINSCVVKLSKLTEATKVYRGISGMGLPKTFWEANDFGVKGAIDGAFMSTTVEREVAMQYASSSNGVGFIFEIQQGM